MKSSPDLLPNQRRYGPHFWLLLGTLRDRTLPSRSSETAVFGLGLRLILARRSVCSHSLVAVVDCFAAVVGIAFR